MATKAVFEYRHKKFDVTKRSREEDTYSSENANISSLPDFDSPIVSIRWTTIPNSSKQREETTSGIARTSTPKLRTGQCTNSELHAKMGLIDLSQTSLEDTNNPPKRRLLQAVNDDIPIKMEAIDSAESISNAILIKREQEISPDNTCPIKVKQELIELNANVPEIPREAFEEICKFRGNMVRKFPKKERSAKEQERRDKNTFACRRSRRVKKIEQVAVEEEYKGYKDTHLRLAEYSIRAAAYFKELMNMTQAVIDDEIIVID